MEASAHHGLLFNNPDITFSRSFIISLAVAFSGRDIELLIQEKKRA